MGVWSILDEHTLSGLTPLIPVYDPMVGWLAGLLAMFAGFAMVPTLKRVHSSRTKKSRLAWVLGGAVTVGIGCWGTQNMALLGFNLPTDYHYNGPFGLLGLLPAIAGCAGAILAVAGPAPRASRLHLGALSLTLGLTVMHYTLMGAIRGDLLVGYDGWLTAQAAILSYGFALLALYITCRTSAVAWARWLAGSVVIGITVLANHFVAMAGSVFYDNPEIFTPAMNTAPPAFMVPAVGGIVLFLIIVYWIGSLIDGRLGEASEAVRSSEARNRAVVETMLDPHLITDNVGTIRSFNPAAELAFGWKAEEVMGKPVTILMHGDRNARKAWNERNDEAVSIPAAKRRWVYANGGRRKDGTTFPVELAISPFTVDGEHFFSCSVRDLSGSWDAEARLRRLATAIEQASDAIVVLDVGFRIEYVNPQYERQTGYVRDEVVGRPPARGLSEQRLYDDMFLTVAQGKTWSGHTRSRRRDGSVRDEELTITPVFDGNGNISGHVAVMRDITKRLESELDRRRLAEALQHCTDDIEILDNQGRIVYVNAAFEARTGQMLADVRGSRPEALSDLTPSGESYDDMMRTAYRGGRPWSGTLRAIGANGETREDDVTVSPMRDERGQVSGYVVVKRDTTDRRRLEVQARQRQKLEAMGHMADGVAHEISAPMRELNDNLRFLQDSFGHLDKLLADLAEFAQSSQPVRPAALAGCMQSADVDFLRREIVRALQDSNESVGRMDGIVRAMRDISRSTPDKVALDLNSAIQSTITATGSEWKPISEIRTDFDPQLTTVHCAPGEISLVMMNLVLNCAQAIASANRNGIRGKGVIHIITRRSNDWAEIRIGTTGRSVSAEERQRMFDPHGNDVQSQAMTLAHDIVVRKHGGSLALDTETGAGAAFVVRLPLGQASAAVASTAAA